MGKKICCIISGGDVNIALLKQNRSLYDYFIAADSGCDSALLAGITPGLLVGDFDSISQHSLSSITLQKAPSSNIKDPAIPSSKYNTKIVKFPVEKDFSDTHLALEEGIRLGYTHFHIYGALGGERFSHSLSNLQTLCLMKSKNIRITLMGTKERVFTLSDESISLNLPKGTVFSVFSLSEKTTGVTIAGAKYPLSDYTLSYLNPLGLSNQSTAETVSISAKSGMLLVVLEI